MYAIVMRFVGWLVVIPIIVLGWCAAILVLFNSPLWKHSEWVSAIGTLGAFGGTIWLSLSADRKQTHAARDRAVIAAAGLLVRLGDLRESVEFCIGHLADSATATFGNGTHPFMGLSMRLSTLELWSDEEVLPLVVLPDRVAARLVVVRSKVQRCYNTMSSWVALDPSVKVDQQSVTASLLYDLRLADQSLKAILSEIGPLAGELHIVRHGPDGLHLTHYP
jgi:hypothetical protein